MLAKKPTSFITVSSSEGNETLFVAVHSSPVIEDIIPPDILNTAVIISIP